jgi:hypothetical protein
VKASVGQKMRGGTTVEGKRRRRWRDDGRGGAMTAAWRDVRGATAKASVRWQMRWLVGATAQRRRRPHDGGCGGASGEAATRRRMWQHDGGGGSATAEAAAEARLVVKVTAVALWRNVDELPACCGACTQRP